MPIQILHSSIVRNLVKHLNETYDVGLDSWGTSFSDANLKKGLHLQQIIKT